MMRHTVALAAISAVVLIPVRTFANWPPDDKNPLFLVLFTK